MSITFFAPDAPTRDVRPYEEEPDYVEKQSALPELNMSNSNAFAFLRLMGLEAGHAGSIACADLPQWAARALELMNRSSLRARATREPSSTQSVKVRQDGGVAVIERGARVIDCGLSDNQVSLYASRFHALATTAHQSGYDVVWG